MTAPPDADPPDADPQTPAPGDASIDWPFVLDDVPKHPRPFVAPDPVPGATAGPSDLIPPEDCAHLLDLLADAARDLARGRR